MTDLDRLDALPERCYCAAHLHNGHPTDGALDAAAKERDELREAAERIVGNGPEWAREYAYDVLRAALHHEDGADD